MLQLDLFSVGCPECTDGVPFAPAAAVAGLWESHWLNPNAGPYYSLRVCTRAAVEPGAPESFRTAGRKP